MNYSGLNQNDGEERSNEAAAEDAFATHGMD
jgi:hypothetical protein